MLGGAEVSAPHLQVLSLSFHLALQPLLLADLMLEGGRCRTPLRRRKIPLLPFPGAWGEPRGDRGIPAYGRGACPWFSIPCHFCLLPSRLPSFPGKFPGMGLQECGSPRRRSRSPIPGNFPGKEGRRGAWWEGGASLGTQEADILLLPRVSGSYFLINWECCSSAGDFQMFPFSSRRPRGCIPHGYGNYCQQRGGGQTPAMVGRGVPRAPCPTTHPGVASSSSPLPWCCQVPPPCSQPVALGAAFSLRLAVLGMSWRQSRF